MRFEDTDIKFLKGVGEQRAKLLADQLDIHTFRDLLEYYPFRYVDRSKFYKIAELRGEMPLLQIRGRFIRFTIEGEGRRKRLIGIFHDGERFMECVWFSKVEKMATFYTPGVDYVLFGKPTQYMGGWQMTHPEIERFDPDKPRVGLQGIYSLTDKSRQRGMGQRVIQNAVRNLILHPNYSHISETIPQAILDRLHLPSLQDTFRQLHEPTDPTLLQKARERMKFEELFYLELQILRYSRDRGRKIAGHILPRIGEFFNNFYNNFIPFELTGAQKRVLKEIRGDMRTGRQMNRLLQGDVGSGKTMVAFMTMLMGVDNGFQCALMAPTEILAGQHFETLSEWCKGLGLNVALLMGSTRTKQRREIHAGLLDGSINIIVGTHALLEEKVEFKNLGIAVIDEQHRFGVAQRAKMWHKGVLPPHVLVMTATPIPRTLAMTVYGDLDVSVIDELPPGRKPVDTWLRTDDNRGEVVRHIKRQLQEGRQIYIVYPLVHENEKLDLRSLEEGYESTMSTYPDVKVSIVHGQMKPAEKDYQMQKFVSGEARILVATTVIEVGVNVPNATVMVIENSERFGLSQLHQLRGRVGRGADRSWCILMTKHQIGADTRKRLGIMTETTDGFLISEADMKMRGPGDMEGTQQSGVAFSLKMANLATDGQIVQYARDAATAMLDANPEIEGRTPEADAAQQPHPWRLNPSDLNILMGEMYRRFAKKEDWSVIS